MVDNSWKDKLMVMLNETYNNEAKLLLPSDIVDAISQVTVELCDKTEEGSKTELLLLSMGATIANRVLNKLFNQK